MAVCGNSYYVKGSCGCGTSNPADAKCVLLKDCKRSIAGHLASLGLGDSYLKTEADLLLFRAGKITVYFLHTKGYQLYFSTTVA